MTTWAERAERREEFERDMAQANIDERERQEGMMSAITMILDDDIHQAHCQVCESILVQISSTEVICPRCAAAELAQYKAYRDALVEIINLGKDSHAAFDGERWREMWKVACAAIETWRA